MYTSGHEDSALIETAQFRPINPEIQHNHPGTPPEFGASMVPKPPDPAPHPISNEQMLPTFPRETDNHIDIRYKQAFGMNNSEDGDLVRRLYSDPGGVRKSSFSVSDHLAKPSAKTEPTFEELLESMSKEAGTLSQLKQEHGDKYFASSYEDLLSYPCEAINNRFGKIPLGEVSVIAGSTGNGKTEFTKSIIIENARNEKRVLVFQTEDTEVGFTKRVAFQLVNEKLITLGLEPMTPIDFYQRRNTDNDEIVREAWEETEALMDNIILAKTSVNGSFLTDMLRISAIFQSHIDLIIIDTLQSVTGIKQDGKDEDMRSIIIQTVMQFARFAAKYNIAVMIVSHITRESSKDGELTVDSLYGASEIAKMASMVIGIRKVEDPLIIGPNRYSTELLLLKSRMGIPRGQMSLRFDPNTTRYSEMPQDISFCDVKSVFDSNELPPPIPPNFSKL